MAEWDLRQQWYSSDVLVIATIQAVLRSGIMGAV